MYPRLLLKTLHPRFSSENSFTEITVRIPVIREISCWSIQITVIIIKLCSLCSFSGSEGCSTLLTLLTLLHYLLYITTLLTFSLCAPFRLTIFSFSFLGNFKVSTPFTELRISFCLGFFSAELYHDLVKG